MGSEAAGSEVEGGCNSAEWVAPGEGAWGSEGAETEVAGNSENHRQTVRVLQVVVEIVGNLGAEVGSGEGEIAGESTAVSVGLEGVVVAAGTAERAAVRGHGERKAGADRESVVGIANTVVPEDEQVAEELVVGVGIDKIAAGVGVAAAASRIGYHHSHSSRTEQTAPREDAVAGPAGVDSIANYKFRS